MKLTQPLQVGRAKHDLIAEALLCPTRESHPDTTNVVKN
ncbi:hypothetical protein D515_03201 [Grimontia indica]|uniref:Uncharacterized protein n=1 Tax=Grimontia indica TaxID=1056512 RepID=R1GPE1_9GAMM|nr:hypothetical protein D515_03201 [Grimontia indica]